MAWKEETRHFKQIGNTGTVNQWERDAYVGSWMECTSRVRMHAVVRVEWGRELQCPRQTARINALCIHSYCLVGSEKWKWQPWENNELPKAIKYGESRAYSFWQAWKEIFYFYVGGFLERIASAICERENELIVPRYSKINHIITSICQVKSTLWAHIFRKEIDGIFK